MRNYKSLLLEIVMAMILIIGIVLSLFSNSLKLSPFVAYGLTVIPVLWYLVKLNARFLWSVPEIKLNPIVDDFLYMGSETLAKNAFLEVRNLEESPITNCYARLQYADHYFPLRSDFVPNKIPTDNHLKWKEKSDDKCEITIPVADLRTINIADTSSEYGFRYHLCNDEHEHNPFPRDFMFGTQYGVVLRRLKIRIDGKWQDKSMKPLIFEGYLFIEDRYENHIRYNEMIFREGDWKKNKIVTEKMNIKR